MLLAVLWTVDDKSGFRSLSLLISLLTGLLELFLSSLYYHNESIFFLNSIKLGYCELALCFEGKKGQKPRKPFFREEIFSIWEDALFSDV